jgi:uncharacterized protein
MFNQGGLLLPKKSAIIVIVLGLLLLSFTDISIPLSNPGEIYEKNEILFYRNVTVYAPAVASTDKGYVGVMSTITVTIQSPGSGKVFVDTLPLTQVDMQGSARLAVKVASALVKNDENCDVNPSLYDYFFVVRTDAPVIGGPSAGGIMTVATVALLQNWSLDEHTVMTGMINPDGSIGPIGGILYKIDAAYNVGVKRFLIPKGQGTYLETVRETVTNNGWTSTQIKTVTRNVVDYVKEKGYDIQVVEVEDVVQAINNFTGYVFSSNYYDGKMKSEEYLNAFFSLSSSLLEESQSLYENASILFTESSDNIPNRVMDWDRFTWIYPNSEIKNFLDQAKLLKDESETWFEREMYYTSTTKSFLSLINSRYVIYACNYYNTDEDDRDNYVSNLIDEVSSHHEVKKNLARNSSITGFVTLQCIGGAQKRASEASDYLTLAENKYEQEEYLSGLEYLARANERSDSVGWWINLTSFFNETDEIHISDIDSLAIEYIEEAQQAIIYSSILLEELGTSSNYLSGAQNMLEDARTERENGYPAAALFEALDAITKANLEIETIGISSENEYREKINRINNSAVESILKSVGYGIKPILPVCYYEYADSLLDEKDLTTALFYYRFSGMIAGALSFTNISKGAISSRYEGVPKFNSPVRYKIDFSFLLVIFGFGALAGLGLGLLIAGLFNNSSKDDAKITKEKKTYDSSTSYTSYKGYSYPNNEIPRSIKDYYRKNK